MRRGQQLSEEQAIAVELGDCYRRLNYLASRIARAQSRGRMPSPAEVTEVTRLKARIAALKSGRGHRADSEDSAANAAGR